MKNSKNSALRETRRRLLAASLLIAHCSLFIAVPRVYAQPGGALVGKDIEEKLLRGELLSGIQFKNAKPELTPANAELRAIFEENSASLTPLMLVESLYLCKKPAPFNDAPWSESLKTAALNVLVSISTLEGIQYYSRSRDAMRTFYEKSSVISGPRQKTPLPDPVFSAGELPENFTLYAMQEDLSFGGNVYRYDYFIGDSTIIFTQTNCNTVSYGIVPLAAKENLRVLAAVIDAGEYFLIYAACMTKAPSFPALKKKAG
ncbi:MAG: hypothetical protein LBF80_05925, partial [Spirochaetaceae bacterium]|nr:hypothetical protein [Spirochaetaceae bacterium]